MAKANVYEIVTARIIAELEKGNIPWRWQRPWTGVRSGAYNRITKKPYSIINQILLNPEDDLPPVSLSVGAAFADRENPGESIFKDADKALYYVKEHGRNGCSFY